MAKPQDLWKLGLVVVDHTTAPLQPSEQVGDDAVVLALLVSFGGLHRNQISDALHWSPERLATAVNVIHRQLEPTGLRLISTDGRLILAVRPGALTELTRQRVGRVERRRWPLSQRDAVTVLRLVRDKVLAPFPDPDGPRRTDSLDGLWLVDSGLAVAIAEPGDHGTTTAVEIHPDVMFALGLADTPATSDAAS
jgi:hypothetical protein